MYEIPYPRHGTGEVWEVKGPIIEEGDVRESTEHDEGNKVYEETKQRSGTYEGARSSPARGKRRFDDEMLDGEGQRKKRSRKSDQAYNRT
jgi:hypothetical protein